MTVEAGASVSTLSQPVLSRPEASVMFAKPGLNIFPGLGGFFNSGTFFGGRRAVHLR